jgi:hypothetical protein
MTSSTCTVNGIVLPTTGNTGINVAAGSNITISLANISNVSAWSISCTSTDDTNQFSTTELINATKIQTLFSCQFTVPAMDGYFGSALQFTSYINNNPLSAVSFGVFVLNFDNSRFFFGGEDLESNITVGCAYDLNQLKVAQLNEIISSGTILVGDVNGLAISNTVNKIQGVVITGTPQDGYVLTATSSTAANWQPAAGSAEGVQVVISANYQVNTTDEVINISGPSTNIVITLPANPFLGETHIIQDRTSSLWLLPATVNGGANNIENATTFVMTGEYTSCTFVWCTSRWMVTANNYQEPVFPLPSIFPVPPNGDYYRAMWSYNNTPLGSDAARAAFIAFCQSVNCNLVFQVTSPNLTDTQYSLSHELQLMKFNSDCYRNGIHVHALLSNEDGYNAYWGDNCNYMMTKAINPLANFQARARSSRKYPNAAFQGVSMDNEWWGGGFRPPEGGVGKNQSGL